LIIFHIQAMLIDELKTVLVILFNSHIYIRRLLQ